MCNFPIVDIVIAIIIFIYIVPTYSAALYHTKGTYNIVTTYLTIQTRGLSALLARVYNLSSVPNI